MLGPGLQDGVPAMPDRWTKFGKPFPARPCIGEARSGCHVFRVDGGFIRVPLVSFYSKLNKQEELPWTTLAPSPTS
jgi:hypothetical protein